MYNIRRLDATENPEIFPRFPPPAGGFFSVFSTLRRDPSSHNVIFPVPREPICACDKPPHSARTGSPPGAPPHGGAAPQGSPPFALGMFVSFSFLGSVLYLNKRTISLLDCFPPGSVPPLPIFLSFFLYLFAFFSEPQFIFFQALRQTVFSFLNCRPFQGSTQAVL